MGFKNDVSTALAELSGRVEALEELASNHLGFVPSTRVYRDTEVTAAAPAEVSNAGSGEVSGVDYGAVAFGLSEIKRKIASQFNVTDAQMQSQWEGTVDYFADVFAKSDPGFDRAAFTRAARR